MSLILAIEPDRRQAAHLTNIVRHNVGAELILADTTEHALGLIGNRAPDLILVPALLSPQDDAALAAALRVIAVATHVQMLTTPVLASGRPKTKARGVLAALRRSKSDEIATDGCDPAVFAEQISSYLERAAEERAAAIEDDAFGVAANPVAEQEQEPEPAAPAAFAEFLEPQVEAPMPEVDATPQYVETYVESYTEQYADEPASQIAAAPMADVVEPFVAEPFVAEPFVAEPFVAEPFVAAPFVAAPFAAEPEETIPAAYEPVYVAPEETVNAYVVPEPEPERPYLMAEPVAAEPVTVDEPVHAAEPVRAPMLDSILDELEQSAPAIDVVGVTDERIGQSLGHALAAEGDGDLTTDIDLTIELEEVLQTLQADQPVVNRTPLSEAAPVNELPRSIEYAAQPIVEARPEDVSHVEAAQAPALEDLSEFEADLASIQETIALTASIEQEKPQSLSAWRSWPELQGVASELPPEESAEAEQKPQRRAPIPAPVVAARKPEAPTRPAAAARPATPERPAAPARPAMVARPAAPVPPVMPTRPATPVRPAVAARPATPARPAASTPAAATPPPAARVAAPAKARTDWQQLIESLRTDIARRREAPPVKRAPAPAAAAATPPRLAKPRTNQPQAQPQPQPTARPAGSRTPVQDEWGFFDPEQCGFAALLSKLDEITDGAPDPSDPRSF